MTGISSGRIGTMNSALALFLSLLLHSDFVKGASLADVEKLYTDIMSSHNKHVRPQTDQSVPTNITIGFTLDNIMEVDAVNGVVTISGQFHISWAERRLLGHRRCTEDSNL